MYVDKHVLRYCLRVVLFYMTCFASTMMGAWIERHYGHAKTSKWSPQQWEQDTLWVSEWAGVVCGSLDTQPVVSICPMDIGGVNICQADCQIIPHRGHP